MSPVIDLNLGKSSHGFGRLFLGRLLAGKVLLLDACDYRQDH
jgi:hypothetical protein